MTSVAPAPAGMMKDAVVVELLDSPPISTVGAVRSCAWHDHPVAAVIPVAPLIVITAVHELDPRVKVPVAPLPEVAEMEQAAVVNLVPPMIGGPLNVVVPVKVGAANVAYACAFTNAVVAIVVELSPVVAVGAVGVPVRAGDASSASVPETPGRSMFAVPETAVANTWVVATPACTKRNPPREPSAAEHAPLGVRLPLSVHVTVSAPVSETNIVSVPVVSPRQIV